jgi:hypothetical protein
LSCWTLGCTHVRDEKDYIKGVEEWKEETLEWTNPCPRGDAGAV